MHILYAYIYYTWNNKNYAILIRGIKKFPYSYNFPSIFQRIFPRGTDDTENESRVPWLAKMRNAVRKRG